MGISYMVYGIVLVQLLKYPINRKINKLFNQKRYSNSEFTSRSKYGDHIDKNIYQPDQLNPITLFFIPWWTELPEKSLAQKYGRGVLLLTIMQLLMVLMIAILTVNS